MSVKLITPDTVPTLRVRRTVGGKTRTRYFRIANRSSAQVKKIYQEAEQLDATWKNEQVSKDHGQNAH